MILNFNKVTVVLPEWIKDSTVVGELCGVPVYAEDIRQLEKALQQVPPTKTTREEIVELLRQGQIINAIKLRRARTGEGLKESKDWVEQVRREEGL